MSVQSNMDSSTTEQWSRTQNSIQQITYMWTIPDVQFLDKKVGEKMLSPKFFSGGGEQEWKLLIYPGGQNEKIRDYVQLYLQLVSSQEFGFTTKFTITILKPNKVVCEHDCTMQWNQLTAWGFSNFMKRSSFITSQDSDSTTTIRCDMTIFSNTVTSSAHEISTGPGILQIRQLGTDFRGLFADPEFSDVSIIVGDEKFLAHKSILTARSPVFAAMFKHKEMEENLKKEVKIENMDSRVVKGMLEYIYTGEVTDLRDLVGGLLEAAEKYDLSGLKTMCVDNMYSFLDNDNAAETLVLADLYDAEVLKEHVIKFIREHLQEVVETEGFEKLSDPAIFRELLRSISVQGKEPKT
ncbi:speckle-type POZ protein [Diachasma alloeum]|uniref:speckle-type POZ protein n=1 Tax=Diachasma alloeum TaxID=454923 RepID=UPI0007381BD5|nr:speckle-type POZ protein [Diachasma alloeum]